jgi:integrase
MAWIEQRGRQHRVYWRCPDGHGRDFEPFEDRAAAARFVELLGLVGPGPARAFVRGEPAPTRAAETEGPGVSLATVFARHLEGCAAAGVRARTLADYRRDFDNHIAAYFGAEVDVRTLRTRGPLAGPGTGRRDTISGWLLWLTQRSSTRNGAPTGVPLSAKTIRGLHGLLSAILEVAVLAEPPVLARNPCHGSRLPRVPGTEMHFLEQAGARALLAELDGDWHTLIWLLLATGLRWGEAAGLNVGDLHLDAAVPYLQVRRAWARDRGGRFVLGRPKTESSLRTVSLPASLVPTLGALAGGRGAGEALFRMPGGGRLHHGNFRSRVFRPAVAAAAARSAEVPVGLRIHDLRHTHASWLVGSGRPINAVAARMGHASIVTTAGYLHRLAGTDRGDAEAIEAILGPDLAPLSPAQRAALVDPALPVLDIGDADDLAA